jgi:hypothetical protein
MKNESNDDGTFTPEEIAEWIRRYRASGLGLGAFGGRHGIPAGRLRYWLYQKGHSKPGKPLSPVWAFQEVRLPAGLSVPPNWAAEVSLSRGVAVRFSGSAAPAWIGLVVEALQRPC